MEVTNDIVYVGVNDHKIDLFEGQYIVPEGMAYNSYVIRDEKTAVIDSVERDFGEQWLDNIAAALDKKAPDYLVIQHMEPDHSSSVQLFAQTYPDAKIVGNAKTFNMIGNFFTDLDIEARKIVVADGDSLSLGRHSLKFIFAPMIHWPEVMMSYESADKVFFSADAFGKFGALDAAGEEDDEDENEWDCEARRYYFGIVGKFGAQVQALLKKLSGYDINIICPLHGPVLSEDLGHYIGLYNIWSSYGVESEGVAIAYTSVYGSTRSAAAKLKELLIERGCPKVALFDLARDDMAEGVEDAFRYGRLVLATTTYNGGIFPFMHEFIDHLISHNYQKRTVAFIENGSWAPTAAKTMRSMLESCKDIAFAENTVTLRSSLKSEDIEALKALAEELWP